MLEDTLDALWQRYHDAHIPLVTTHDPDWPSPCEVALPYDPHSTDETDQQLIRWQPVKRHETADDFSNLEAALEIPIHPDIKRYYARYWAANLDARAHDGLVNLLFLWNQEDVDRLIENLIGHAVACRYNKTPFAIFFACTKPDEDLFLTVNNDNGQVQLETPGKAPLRVVADSLDAFLQTLEPVRQPLTGGHSSNAS